MNIHELVDMLELVDGTVKVLNAVTRLRVDIVLNELSRGTIRVIAEVPEDVDFEAGKTLFIRAMPEYPMLSLGTDEASRMCLVMYRFSMVDKEG